MNDVFALSAAPASTAVAPAVKETGLAWAAGFVDGEGCLHIARQVYTDARRRPTYNFRLTVNQSDFASLQRLQSILGERSYLRELKWRTGMNKRPYALAYFGPAAYAALLLLYPYLFVKRAQADVVLDFYATCQISRHPGCRGQDESIWRLRAKYYRKLRRMK